MLKWFQTMLKKSKEEKGFSLIELMVVVAIIGILFVVLVPKLNGAKDSARGAGVKTDFRSFQVAITNYVEDLMGTKSLPANLADFRPKYLDSTLTSDPWTRTYVYDVSPDGLSCVVHSQGPTANTGTVAPVIDDTEAVTGLGNAGTTEDDRYMVLILDATTGRVTLDTTNSRM